MKMIRSAILTLLMEMNLLGMMIVLTTPIKIPSIASTTRLMVVRSPLTPPDRGEPEGTVGVATRLS